MYSKQKLVFQAIRINQKVYINSKTDQNSVTEVPN